MTTTTIRTRPFDMANYLGTDEDVAEYLSQVLADGDPAELAAALGDIARARGMTQLARDTGVSLVGFMREQSYVVYAHAARIQASL